MHLSKRLKERAGIPKRAQERFIKLILERGQDISAFKSNSDLHKYLVSILKDGYDLKVYGQYVLVMSDTKVGVTLLTIPKQYYKRGELNGTNGCEDDPTVASESQIHKNS